MGCKSKPSQPTVALFSMQSLWAGLHGSGSFLTKLGCLKKSCLKQSVWPCRRHAAR